MADDRCVYPVHAPGIICGLPADDHEPKWVLGHDYRSPLYTLPSRRDLPPHPTDVQPGDELALLKVTVAKLHAQNKLMHQMLSEAGIREDVLADGVRTCVSGRLAVALSRMAK